MKQSTPPIRLLLDPPAAGAWNMAVDEALLEDAAATDQSTLRFYQWEEPTLSLGYFQNYTDRWQHAASSQVAVVRRASGGGAILHDIDLTYSFAVPARHALALDRLNFYQMVHTALIETLAQWGIQASLFSEAARHASSLAEHLPNVDLRKSQPFLCFERRSPGDVLVGQAKIAGSAQRRSAGAVLQHGSVLLARSQAAPELTGLKELVDIAIRPNELAEAWLARLGSILPITWQLGELSEELRHRAMVLAREKYASPAWVVDRFRS